MFWGASIKSGKSITVEAQSTSKDEQDDLLHISNVALAHNAGGGRVYLNVQRDGKTFTICSLQKDKTEHVSVDLYFKPSEEATLSTKGDSTIHLTGYWEPSQDLLDDDLGMGQMEMDPGMIEDEEPEEEMDEETANDLRLAEENAKKNSAPPPQESDDSSSGDEEEVL